MSDPRKPASLHALPAEARRAEPEEFLYVACLHEGTGVSEPDFVSVVDAENGRIIHETPMPNVGGELHHYGWNRCSSACHGPDRSHLIVPGFRSSRIHILNIADDPRRPWIEKVIEPDEVVEKTGYTRPHVHSRRELRHLLLELAPPPNTNARRHARLVHVQRARTLNDPLQHQLPSVQIDNDSPPAGASHLQAKL
jgi:hypothetical protein